MIACPITVERDLRARSAGWGRESATFPPSERARRSRSTSLAVVALSRAAAAALLVVVAAGRARADESPPAATPAAVELRAPPRREAAPALRLPDLGGIDRGIEDYAGKVVVVHFWTTWCVPCREELPELQALGRRLGPQGFVVLTVAPDRHDAVAAFVAEVGLDLPVVIDQYGSALRAYRVAALPATFVVGRDGRIEWTADGRVAWHSPRVAQELARLLGR